MTAERKSQEGEPTSSLFPPLVRFRVFVEAIEELGATSSRDRETVLESYAQNDRSQLLRSFALFGIRSADGRYDEMSLRRLAARDRRPDALRELLNRHYPAALDAIQHGLDRAELEDLLATPRRGSTSSREKARQFLENAMHEAGLPTDRIRRASRQARSSRLGHDLGTSIGTRVPAAKPKRSLIRQQREFLDMLLARYHVAEDEARQRELEELIQDVSKRLDTYLGQDNPESAPEL